MSEENKVEIQLDISEETALNPRPADFIRLHEQGDMIVMDVGFIIRDAKQIPVRALVTNRFHLARSLVENLKNNMLSADIPVMMAANTEPGERS